MMLNMSSGNSSSNNNNNNNNNRSANDGNKFNHLYEQSYQQQPQQQHQLLQQQNPFLPYHFHLQQHQQQQQQQQHQLNQQNIEINYNKYNASQFNYNYNNNNNNNLDDENQEGDEEEEERQTLIQVGVENKSMCTNETIKNNKMSQNVAAICSKSERESIHSGHFMVSQFEAEEEAQDDLDDDDVADEVQMPSLATQADESTPCLEVQLYVPRKVTNFQNTGSSGVNRVIGCGNGGVPGGITYDIGSVASHVEIETSLTKLFKCMSLAYSQKLTSPKWNHFKGVRLRWKDKIRLNNVIWRCWHMQFILKKRTPVCQFASPLDVDIHSNPESVVLEGKYWKRQLAVIKAEYRKWRRNFKSKATGCLTYDTKSEFDLLDWSPSFMLSEDWTSDTLFSAINGPFPFPDPREIARAGIADFIQPSLGPLQPNLEDIDVTFQELLQSTRLPPVPEEAADDMLKSVDYSGFQTIMGPPEQMDASNIMDNVVATTTINTNVAIASNALSNTNNNSNNNNDVDTNMLELNQLQYNNMEQQFLTRDNNGGMLLANNAATGVSATNSEDQLMTDNNLQPPANSTCSASKHNLKHYNSNGADTRSQLNNDHTASSGKSVMKGRISKSFQKLYRREPHNYDKAQPTFHQTSIYQQILAEQQKNQLQQQTNATTSYQQAKQQQQHQQQQQQQLCYQYQTAASSGVCSGGGGRVVNGNGDAYIYANDTNNTTPQTTPTAAKTAIINTPRTSNLIGTTATAAGVRINLAPTVQQQQQQQLTSTKSNVIVSHNNNNNSNNMMMMNVIKLEPQSNDVLSMFNLTTGASVVTPTASALLTTSSSSATTTNTPNKGEFYAPIYKPYPSVSGNCNDGQQEQQQQQQQQHIFKKSSSTGTFVNIRGLAPAISNYLLAQQQQQQQAPNTSAQQQQQQMQHTQSLPITMPIMSTAQQQQQQQQHQQQQQQEQLNTFGMQQQLSPTASQQQLTVIEQQQQQQQQQQSIFPKEIYRSNSLPLNVTLQKVDNFLVPKYTAHGGNTNVGNKSYSGSSANLLNMGLPNIRTQNARVRSNSMQPNIIMANNFYPATDNTMDNNGGNDSLTMSSDIGMNSNNYLNAPAQLQTATSEPMLNSTLAQLLTCNSRMPNITNYNIKQQQQQPSNANQHYNLTVQQHQRLQQHQQQQSNLYLSQQKKENVAGAVSSLELQAVRVQQQMQRHMQLQQQQHHHHHQQQQQNTSSIIKTITTTVPSTSSTTSASSSSSLLLTKQNKSPKKTQSLPATAPSPLLHSPPNKMKSFPLSGSINCASSMNTLSLSPESYHDQDSPLSPTHSLSKFPRDNQRRAGHIHAEQKRRYNIKNGFDMLYSLIPQLQQNPNIRLSKAAMLQKGAEHIKHLRSERNVLQERMEALRQERDSLNNSLTHLHSILPANGAPVTRQGTEHVRQLYEQYVRYRTNEHNWKFWILGFILEPLLSSYTASVSSTSMDEMRRTAFLWVDQHCSLIDLRPAVSNKLKYLSMKTDILSDPPSMLEEEVAKAINYTTGQHPNLHGT